MPSLESVARKTSGQSVGPSVELIGRRQGELQRLFPIAQHHLAGDEVATDTDGAEALVVEVVGKSISPHLVECHECPLGLRVAQISDDDSEAIPADMRRD